MRRISAPERVSRLEQEIRRKEGRAHEAKEKGMHATFSTYKSDLAILKVQLQKLRTDPSRVF